MDKDYIIECLVNEKKIEAIKYVRTKAGYSLKAAMKYVDDIEKEFSIKGRTSSDLTDMNLFDLAVEFVLERGVVSVSMLQRKLNLGYNDAAKIFELMEYNGIISGYNGSKPRNVIISKYEWNHMRQSVKYKKRIILHISSKKNPRLNTSPPWKKWMVINLNIFVPIY